MTEDQEVVLVVLAGRYCETARSRRMNESRRRSHDYVAAVARMDELGVVLAALTDVTPAVVRSTARLGTFEDHPIEPGPDWVKAAGRDLADRLMSATASER